MKNILLVAMILTLAAFGCGQGTNSGNPDNKSTSRVENEQDNTSTANTTESEESGPGYSTSQSGSSASPGTSTEPETQSGTGTGSSSQSGSGTGSSVSGTGTGSSTSSQTQTGTQPNENERGKDLEFVNEAASAGLMEVQLAKLAQQKATSQAVKDFGRMMERDHSDANNKLRSAMQKVGVPVTSSLLPKHEDHIEDLSEKSGSDFDKAYIDMMVKDHKDDVDKFEKAADDLQDPALKQWASSTLPVLKKHLSEAQRLQEQVK